MTETAAATHAVRETFDSTLHAIGRYVAPLVGAVAGFMAGPVLGGARSIANMIWGTTGNGSGLSGASSNRIAGTLMALISGGIGLVFWHMRKRGGVILELVGGLIGGFFMGVALFNVQFLVTGNQPPSGAIESWSDSAAAIAGGQ